MEFNSETFELMTSFALIMLGVLLLIFLLAVVTPKMAKFIDQKVIKKEKKDASDDVTPPESVESEYKVRSIYEAEIFTDKKTEE